MEIAQSHAEPNIGIAIRTLAQGGFFLDGAIRNPGYVSLRMSRFDEFGITQKYSFSLFENEPTESQINMARIDAKHNNAYLVLVSPAITENPIFIDWDRFINIFGGPIANSDVLDSDFSNQLISLGHNTLPPGIEGKPDDLFEIYVRNAFEFIFRSKVIRYGQDRLFEERPDGIVIHERDFSALYDAKAYSAGYDVKLDSIRQFKSYVTMFQRSYSQFITLNVFIVISGSFQQMSASLTRRSRDMLAESGIPLSFLRAEVLADIVQIFINKPLLRRSINWRKVFSNPIIEKIFIEDEIEQIEKDKIIPVIVR